MHAKKNGPENRAIFSQSIVDVMAVMMVMTAMLDDHEPFRAGAVPAALGIALFANPHVYASAHLATFTAHADAALTAVLAADTFATFAANFDPALRASTLSAHLAAAFRPARIALDLAARCGPDGCGSLIDRDAGAGFRGVLREGRRCNCDRRSGGEQITQLAHVDSL
jgi:hypothetical protein